MNKIDNSGAGIATLGRDEDSYMAHVAAGEMVVPPVISPETRARLFQEMQQVGLDPNEYTVGEGMSINPITGMPEFGFLKKVFKSVKKVAKKVAPVVLPMVLPGVGNIIGGGLSSLGSALGIPSGIGSGFLGGSGILDTFAKARGGITSLLGGTGGGDTQQGIGTIFSNMFGGPMNTPSNPVASMFGGPMNTPGINVGSGVSSIPAANYTTVQGDTLSQIAARNNLTLDQLKAANPQLARVFANPETLQIGETVNIPGATFRDPVTGQIVNTTSGIGNFRNFLNNILGSGQNQNQNQGIFGGGAANNLANLAIIKKILDQPTGRDPAELVPMGQSAFGYTPQQIANIPSYRIGNLTPALIEGQEYANVRPVVQAEAGGIISLQAGGDVNPDRMDDDGPGDITPAFLEPGEFVMTRKATRNLGARNLYKLMKEAEQMV